jgi:hypothetical protein
MARKHNNRRSINYGPRGKRTPPSIISTATPDPPANPTDRGHRHVPHHPYSTGVVTHLSAPLPTHQHDTRQAASHRRNSTSRLPVIMDQPTSDMANQAATPSYTNFPVSVASFDADAPPPPPSFNGTPIDMLPDELSIQNDQ